MAIKINKHSPFTGNQTYNTKIDEDITTIKVKSNIVMGKPGGLNSDSRYFGNYLFILSDLTFKSSAPDAINASKLAVVFTATFTDTGNTLPTNQSYVLRIFHEGQINTTSAVFLNSTGTIPSANKVVDTSHAQAYKIASPIDITFPNLQAQANRDRPYTLEARILDNKTGEFIATYPTKVINFDWE